MAGAVTVVEQLFAILERMGRMTSYTRVWSLI